MTLEFNLARREWESGCTKRQPHSSACGPRPASLRRPLLTQHSVWYTMDIVKRVVQRTRARRFEKVKELENLTQTVYKASTFLTTVGKDSKKDTAQEKVTRQLKLGIEQLGAQQVARDKKTAKQLKLEREQQTAQDKGRRLQAERKQQAAQQAARDKIPNTKVHCHILLSYV